MKKIIFFVYILFSFLSLRAQEEIFDPFYQFDDYRRSKFLTELPGGKFIYNQERAYLFNSPEELLPDIDSVMTALVKLRANIQTEKRFEIKTESLDSMRFIGSVFFDAENNLIIGMGANLSHTLTFPPTEYNYNTLFKFDTDLNLLQKTIYLDSSGVGGFTTLINSKGNLMKAGVRYADGEEVGTGVEERNTEGEIVTINNTLPLFSSVFDGRKQDIIVEFSDPTEYHVIFDDTIAVLNEDLELLEYIPYNDNFHRTPSVAHAKGSDSYWFGGWWCGGSPGTDYCYEVGIKVTRGSAETEYHNMTTHAFLNPDVGSGEKGAFSTRYADYNYMANNVGADPPFVSLTSFDDDGNIRWQKNLINSVPEYASFICHEITAARDTGVIVTARVSNFVSDAASGLYFIRFDKDGNSSLVLADTEEAEMPFTIRDVSAYPNPTQEHLYFAGDLPQNYQTEIYDARGRRLHFGEGNKGADVSDLPDGMYFYRLTDKGKILATGKFLKKK